MSTELPPAWTPPATEDQAEQMADRAIAVVYATALGVVRLCNGSSDDLPRLCVSAACHTVERLANNPDGHPVALTAAHDLRSALREALDRTERFIAGVEEAPTRD